MIGDPPEYSLDCNCGIKISGTNENGLVSLMKKHLETGKYHTAWMLVNNFNSTVPTILESTIKEASAMKKGL